MATGNVVPKGEGIVTKMTISYGSGRRARNGFMPVFIVEKELSFGDGCWTTSRHLNPGFQKRSVSLRSIRRMLKSKAIRVPEGNRIVIPHWKIGYADLVVTLK